MQVYPKLEFAKKEKKIKRRIHFSRIFDSDFRENANPKYEELLRQLKDFNMELNNDSSDYRTITPDARQLYCPTLGI